MKPIGKFRKYWQKAVAVPTLFILLPPFIRFYVSEPVSNQTWDFSTPSEYVYDASKIEIASGQAHLTGEDGWLDPTWLYRRQITLDNSEVLNTQIDFQVEIKLTSANFDFAKAQSDGSDIRVTLDNGATLINHWLEAYDPVAQMALITVRVPELMAGEIETLWLYYGNSAAGPASTWNGVFASGLPDTPVATPLYSTGGHSAFPALVRLGSGTILAAFRNGSGHTSTDGSIMIARSMDEGVNWTTSLLFNEPDIDDRVDLGLTRLANGTLILPFYQHDGDEPTGSFILKSTDSGASWSEKIPIPDLLPGWLAVYGRIIELNDGTILLPAYGIESSGAFMESVLLQSLDQGDSWTIRSTIASGSVNYNETSVCNLGSGHFVGVVRGETVPSSLYLVHSYDSGLTWSDPVWFNDGASPEIVTTGYGSLMLLSADRKGPVTGIRAVYSADNGFSWSDGVMISYGTGDLGYPTTLKINKNTYLTIFYEQDRLMRTFFTEDYVTNNPNYNNLYDGMESGSLSNWSFLRGSTIGLSSIQKHDGNASLFVSDASTFSQVLAVHPISLAPRQTGSVSFWIRPQTITQAIEFGLLDDLLLADDPLADRRFWFRITPDGALQYNSHRCTDWSNLSSDTAIDFVTWTKITLQLDTLNQLATVFINGEDKGMADQCSTGANIEQIAFSSGSVAGTGDSYFVDDLYSGQSVWPYPVASVEAEQTQFPTDNPTIASLNTQLSAPSELLGFYESAVKNGGEIKYQLSNDGGSTWRWWNGTQWQITAGGYEAANTANIVNSRLNSFSIGSGQIAFKAFLHSNGTQSVRLDSVQLHYSGN